MNLYNRLNPKSAELARGLRINTASATRFNLRVLFSEVHPQSGPRFLPSAGAFPFREHAAPIRVLICRSSAAKPVNSRKTRGGFLRTFQSKLRRPQDHPRKSLNKVLKKAWPNPTPNGT